MFHCFVAVRANLYNPNPSLGGAATWSIVPCQSKSTDGHAPRPLKFIEYLKSNRTAVAAQLDRCREENRSDRQPDPQSRANQELTRIDL
jgi:hypothetical protein